MTTGKHLKRRVRLRAAETGEPYATVLRRIRQQQEDRMPPSTTTSSEKAIVPCSFCGKPNTAVQRLVAGPGVYICNECVELSAAIVADASGATPEESARRRSEYDNLSTEVILALLPALVRHADQVEAELAGHVNRLRGRGTAWQTIADAAGTSVDSVRQRFEGAPSE